MTSPVLANRVGKDKVKSLAVVKFVSTRLFQSVSQATSCPLIVANGLSSLISTRPRPISLVRWSGLSGVKVQRFATISFSVHRRSIASSPNCESGSSIIVCVYSFGRSSKATGEAIHPTVSLIRERVKTQGV